jgi:carbamoyl-phosphate synthase large subunit
MEIYRISGVDPFFLYKIQNIVNMEDQLKALNLAEEGAAEVIREAKRIGFSDEQIAVCQKTDEMTIRNFRKTSGITPVVKQIDTLAAEWPAKTNYLYMTYGGEENDIEFTNTKSKVIVLGAGVFRIGSSVEFDWCGVNTVWALKKNGIKEAIMVNYNPETVSTDYDISDKLYFEELTTERDLDGLTSVRSPGFDLGDPSSSGWRVQFRYTLGHAANSSSADFRRRSSAA